MSNKHPLSPPPLAKVKEWIVNNNINTISVLEASAIATAASHWGWKKRGAANEKELQKARDQELEACIEWLLEQGLDITAPRLRATRRPSQPSLKQQAIELIEAYGCPGGVKLTPEQCSIIRRALEQTND